MCQPKLFFFVGFFNNIFVCIDCFGKVELMCSSSKCVCVGCAPHACLLLFSSSYSIICLAKTFMFLQFESTVE